MNRFVSIDHSCSDPNKASAVQLQPSEHSCITICFSQQRQIEASHEERDYVDCGLIHAHEARSESVKELCGNDICMHACCKESP